MIERDESEEQLMNYLLGNISEAEREQIEQRLLTDDEFFAQVERLESELADDYVQGRLSAAERERFEEHFLRSEEGREQAAFAALLVEYAQRDAKTEGEEASPTNTDAASDDKTAPDTRAEPAAHKVVPFAIFRRAWANPYLRMAASLVIVAGLGLLIYRLFIYQSDVDKGLAALKKAYKSERPTEARITGFDYAPYSVTRGGNDKAGDTLEKERAERILLDAVHDHPGAESYYGLGKWYLADKRFDKAIEQFDKALQLNDKDARTHADMGAAYLERGKTLFDKPGGKAVESFAKSIEHLSRALELNENLLDARFNYAMALQQMGLPQRAKEEWLKYLEKDSQSKWADEAREKLKALEEQIKQTSLTKEEVLAQFLEAYRSGNDNQAWEIICWNREPISGRFITEQLLDDYLNKKLNNEEAAAQEAFKALTYASNLERQRASEHYSEYLVNFYSKQPLENLQRLKEARSGITQGHQLYSKRDTREAIRVYGEAESAFERFNDEAEALMAKYRLGFCQTELYNTQESQPIFEALVPLCKDKAYRWLWMRVLYSTASCFLIRREYTFALSSAEESVKIAESIGDKISIFHSLDLLTETYRFLTNYSRALECIQRSLPYLNTAWLKQTQKWRHYSIVASTFTSAKMYRAALEVQKDVLRLAISDIPNEVVPSYANLGAIYGKLNNYNDAIKAVQIAYNTALTIADEKMRNDKIAYSLLHLGHLYRQSQNYSEAIKEYQDCITLCEQFNFPFYVYQAHKGNLLCCIGLNDAPLIEKELDTTVNLIEQSRSEILEAENRNSFFDSEQDIYDVAIAYELAKGSPQQAFAYSEASRARSLLDLMQISAVAVSEKTPSGNPFPKPIQPLPAAELQQRFPEQAQVIQYAVLENQISIWLLSKSTFVQASTNITAPALTEKVQRYLQLISQPSGKLDQEAETLSKELFDLLLAPVKEQLDKHKALFIIPDKILASLPFEALRCPDTNSYVVEDYTLAYAPSASIFVRCSGEAEKRGMPKTERLLSVGNPHFNRLRFEELPDLPNAREEALGVAALYSSSLPLTDDDATKKKVVNEMQKADIIHLATHSLADEYVPSQSKILFTGESKGSANSPHSADDYLEAQEIDRLNLSHTRLVVLSSCQSAIGRYYKGEGIFSLARSFLIAGTPLVIASLWSVDSAATADLMIRFHRQRQGKMLSSIEALRKAQLDMLQNPNLQFRHPYYWASFISVGGYTSF